MKSYTLKSIPGTPSAEMELQDKFPGFTFWSGVFGYPPGYIHSEKVKIFAHYWHGDYSGYIREKYGTMYKKQRQIETNG